MLKFLKEAIFNLIDGNRGPGFFQEVDDRNFLGQNIAGDITREDLTDKPFLTIHIKELIDQKYTDFCVGCGSAYASEGTEGIPMSWNGAYAFYCKYIGRIPEYGASILKLLLAKKKYGIPTREDCPFRPDKGRDWNADWRNIPDVVFQMSKLYGCGSVWEAKRPDGWDRFDTFRAYLNKFKDKKIAIQAGIDSHNVTFIGQDFHPETKELCLVCLDSYGTKSIKYRVGKSFNGIRYFTRSEANQVSTGNFTFDIPVDLAKILNSYNEKAVKTADSADCYLVRNGERHLLKNEYVALANGCLLYAPNNVYEISKEEMDVIPLGDHAKFRDGKYWGIVQRILELLGKTDLLNEEE